MRPSRIRSPGVPPLKTAPSNSRTQWLGLRGCTLRWVTRTPFRGKAEAPASTTMLAGMGYEVVASTGKADQGNWLRNLGASDVIGRDETSPEKVRPLDRERWQGVVDCVQAAMDAHEGNADVAKNALGCLGNLADA